LGKGEGGMDGGEEAARVIEGQMPEF